MSPLLSSPLLLPPLNSPLPSSLMSSPLSFHSCSSSRHEQTLSLWKKEHKSRRMGRTSCCISQVVRCYVMHGLTSLGIIIVNIIIVLILTRTLIHILAIGISPLPSSPLSPLSSYPPFLLPPSPPLPLSPLLSSFIKTSNSDGEDNSHNHKKRSTSTADGWVSSFWSWGTSYSFFSAQWTGNRSPPLSSPLSSSLLPPYLLPFICAK